MIVLAGCLMIFDIRGWRRLARPFEIVGINAIFVFVGSGLFDRTQPHHVTAADRLKVMQSLGTRKKANPAAASSRISSTASSEAETNAASIAYQRLAERQKRKRRRLLRDDQADERKSLHGWLYRTWTSWITTPNSPRSAWHCLTVAFWWFVCWLMSLFGLGDPRMKIVVKPAA